jgi:hypothetical protein
MPKAAKMTLVSTASGQLSENIKSMISCVMARINPNALTRFSIFMLQPTPQKKLTTALKT